MTARPIVELVIPPYKGELDSWGKHSRGQCCTTTDRSRVPNRRRCVTDCSIPQHGSCAAAANSGSRSTAPGAGHECSPKPSTDCEHCPFPQPDLRLLVATTRHGQPGTEPGRTTTPAHTEPLNKIIS